MKKLQLGVSCILLLIFTCGCTPIFQELPSPQEYTEDTYASNESKSTPYTALSYSGIDTNPQNLPNSYHVDNDSRFVADVWSALSYDAWTEQEGGSVAMVSIELIFSDGSSCLSVEIDPNDTGWRKNAADSGSSEIPKYFSLPAGAYERIKNLLTTYTSEHFMPEISLDLLKIDIKSAVPLVFDSDEIYFQLSPELAGEFTSSWNTNAWEEAPIDYTESGSTIHMRGIYCIDGRGPIEVIVDRDQKSALIIYDGMSKIYKIPEDIVQTIYSQFDNFRLLSQS